MPRLSVVDPAQATGKVKEIFDGPLKGKHRNIFKGMANSPAALGAYVALTHALKDGELTPAERETIAIAAGQLNGCDYCVAAHTVMGKMAGLSEGETVAIRRGAPTEPKLAALTKFVAAMNEKRGFVNDADVAAVRAAGYGDGHIAEIVAVYALNLYTNYFNHLNETDIDFPAPPAL